MQKNLEYLRLDTIELVGHEKGTFEKTFSAVAGILIFLTGIFLFLLLTFLLKKQNEAYNENKDIENFEISLKWKWRKDTP